MEALKIRKINLSFIKELHSLLLKGRRGERFRGEFRKTQVFIGEEGSTIEKATYIPPESILILDYMENLENYILNNKDNPLIKSAIIHYQFEAIHPFQDGNGRIGRLIIPLYLYKKGLLYQPILFLSGYFEENRNQYIDMLHLVDTQQKYEEWIKFFLISIKNQAIETQKLIYQIKNLNKNIKAKTETIKSPFISKVIEFIFRKPIFSPSEMAKEIKSNRITSLRLIKKLQELKILTSFIPSRKKRKLYVFNDLINIL